MNSNQSVLADCDSVKGYHAAARVEALDEEARRVELAREAARRMRTPWPGSAAETRERKRREQLRAWLEDVIREVVLDVVSSQLEEAVEAVLARKWRGR